MDYKDLGRAAVEAKKQALPKYSNFHVGAALLSSDGSVIRGCNVESASYSLTQCAERTAIFKAISDGHRSFSAIAIASDYPGFCPPCGACRQVIFDQCGDIDIIMTNHDGEIKVLKASELLPLAFTDDSLPGKAE